MKRDADPGPSLVVSSGELARLYGKERSWGRRLLRQWWEEQNNGGERKVWRRGKRGDFFTTHDVLARHMPRGRDERMWRRIESLERDVAFAFARIAELERASGRRR